MTRYHATPEGNIPFTPSEELEADTNDLLLANSELTRIKNYKLTQLDEKALEVEVQGVNVGGMEIATDRESIARITSALSLMGRNPTESIDFEAKNGWNNANKAGLEVIQDSCWTHIKSINANKKLHSDYINDPLRTIQDVIDYDINTGW